MALHFYNKFGKAIVYCDDNIHLFTFNGEPIGYFNNNLIYTYSGDHIGFFLDGWIRDLNGYCVFFCENATGGMLKPLRQLLPLKAPKHYLPYKSFRKYTYCMPIKRLAWSRYSDLDFFS